VYSNWIIRVIQMRALRFGLDIYIRTYKYIRINLITLYTSEYIVKLLVMFRSAITEHIEKCFK
jgi:hypothetical protein